MDETLTEEEQILVHDYAQGIIEGVERTIWQILLLPYSFNIRILAPGDVPWGVYLTPSGSLNEEGVLLCNAFCVLDPRCSRATRHQAALGLLASLQQDLAGGCDG